MNSFNTSYEKLSFYNNMFNAFIDGDSIYSSDFYGNRQLQGVTLKKHQETLDLLNTYYNKLVDLGAIEKEKSAEEIAMEQNQLMQQLLNQLQDLKNEVKEIKGSKLDEHTADSSNSNKKFESKSTKQSNTIDKQSERSA